MCGIYGFSLKHRGNRALALANFKILGLYNIERGKDSCGVCIDGKIKKSILLIIKKCYNINRRC